MTQHEVLSAARHADLTISRARGEALGDGVMACLTFASEFRSIQAHYPIVFQQTAARDDYRALALTGFGEGENLFLRHGQWDAAYVPLSIDIQPFLIGSVAQGAQEKQVHIDMASPRIVRDGDDGIRLFDDSGTPSAFLEDMAEKLGQLNQGYGEGAAFLAFLQQEELLEPFTLEIELDDGSAHDLVGFHTINETRLRALPEDTVMRMHRDGFLQPVYMALASLSNLAALVRRKNALIAGG